MDSFPEAQCIEKTRDKSFSPSGSTLPPLKLKSSWANEPGSHAEARRKSLEDSPLKKQQTISMTVEEIRRHRRFDPRYQQSESEKVVVDQTDTEEQEEFKTGKLLLERARSVRIPSSRMTPRGHHALPSPKSLVVELIEESQLQAVLDPLPALQFSGGKAQPTTQDQMVEKYNAAMEEIRRKKNQLDAAMVNASDLIGVPDELKELFAEVQAFSLSQNAARAGLGISEQRMQERFKKISDRVDSIPSAVTKNSAGDVILLPLPKRGVEGWKVNDHGQIFPTSKLTGYMSMSPNANELKRIRDSLRDSHPVSPNMTKKMMLAASAADSSQGKQSRPPSSKVLPIASTNPPHNRYAASGLINRWSSSRFTDQSKTGSNKNGLAAAVDSIQETNIEEREMEEAYGPDAPCAPFYASDGSIDSDDDFAQTLGYQKDKEKQTLAQQKYVSKKKFSWLEKGISQARFLSKAEARSEVREDSTHMLHRRDDESEGGDSNGHQQFLAEIFLPVLHSQTPPPPHDFTSDDVHHGGVLESKLKRRLELCIETSCTILDLDFAPHLREAADFDLILRVVSSHDAAPLINGIKAQEGLIATKEAVSGLAYLCKQLSIEFLDLNGCKALDPEGASELVPLVHEGRVSHLDLSNCPIGSEGCTIILQAAGQGPHLQFLNLSHCGIIDFKLLLAKALASSSLTHLILTGNKIQTTFAAQSLALGLEGCKTLEHLDLSHCCLHDLSGVSIGKLTARLPSLKVLNLSHNLMGWVGASSLAKELLSCQDKTLEHLIFDHNPIGKASACHLMSLIQSWPKDPHLYISLTGCNLEPLTGHPVSFNPLLPSGHYHLDLASSAHYTLAKRLIEEVWRPCRSSWLSATLDDSPVILNDSTDWPASLPKQGKLTVVILHAQAVDYMAQRVKGDGPKAPLMNPRLRHVAEKQLIDPAVDDEWRLTYIRCLTRTVLCTAAQAGALLRSFEYRSRKVEAARLLLSVTIDLARFSSSMLTKPEDGRGHATSPPLDYDDLLDLLNSIGLDHKMPSRSPGSVAIPSSLSPGWQLSCSGPYTLNLGLQVERFLAILLIELAEREGKMADSLSFFQSSPGQEWGQGPEGSSKARIGDRRAAITHAYYNDQHMDFSLVLDTVNLPTSGILRFTFRNQSMSWADKKRILFSLHQPRDKIDEPFMPEPASTPRRRGTVDVNNPAISLGHQARASVGGRLSSSAFVSRRVAARAEDAQAFNNLFSDLLHLLHLPINHATIGSWKAYSVGGQQQMTDLVKEAEARHCSYLSIPAHVPEDEEDGGKKSKVKVAKKGKKGKKEKEKKKKAKGESEGAEGAGDEKKLLEARRQAPSVLIRANDFCIAHSITPSQLIVLLRLLPDLDTRLNLLAMLRSSLSDPSSLVDVALTCDHPVALPHTPIEKAPPSNETPPHNTQPPIFPMHFSPGPDVASSLISSVASRVGWSRMMLQWSRPGSLDNVPIDISLHNPEDIQALAHLCRIDELCSSAERWGRQLGSRKITLEVLSGEEVALHSVVDSFQFGSKDGSQWTDSFHITHDSSIECQSSLNQIISQCGSALYHERLRVNVKMTRKHQEVAAAVMIQSAWRAALARRRAMKALRKLLTVMAKVNKWREAWASFLMMRRMALFRTSLAPDLELRRLFDKLGQD